tara:strand:+ start:29 stop:3088 length:3060 start_codon:yes stop_codon:yes gene_type:complete
VAIFTGFKPSGMQKIANRLGYKGNMVNFDNYLEQNPDKKRQMIVFEDAAKKMAEGGVVKAQQGQFIGPVEAGPPAGFFENQNTSRKAMQGNPVGGSPQQGQFFNNLTKNINQFNETQNLAENQFKGFPKDFTVGYRPTETGGGLGYQAPDGTLYEVPEKNIPRGESLEDYYKSFAASLSRPKPKGYDTDPVKPPVLRDVTREVDLSKIDDRGFAPTLADPRNFVKVDGYIKDIAQKEYDEALKQYQNYQNVLGKNFTQKQADDYDKQQRVIKRNEVQKKINPNLDLNFYNSPEYKKYEEEQMFMPGTMDVVVSPYFGERGSGSKSRAEDNAYIAYLKRTGQENLISQGIIPNYKANTFAPEMASEVPTPTADARELAQQSVPQQQLPTQTISETSDITDVAAQRLSTPGLPEGTQIIGQGIQTSEGQFVPSTTGQVTGSVAVPTTMAGTTVAELPTPTTTAKMEAEQVTQPVETALSATQAAQINPQDPLAKINAAQATASSIGNLNAAQGNAILIDNPVQREIQTGELISGVANAEKAAAFTEQIQAATASPSEKASATNQLASLTANFDATNPPAWAAGAIRGVQAVMQERGLGSSSIAGQALVQAAMESAIPLAQAEAETQARFELQNLSNRQSRAMLAAEQRASFLGLEFNQEFQARVQNAARIADIAGTNFNAEQQVLLENSRLTNSMNLQNLSNRNALVIAEASALANMDLTNLNNRQQAAVQNAQNFLNSEMSNVDKQQQVELFKAQQRIQSLFTDQAATNASRQFNASSENQLKQFFANLITQTSQFNATQQNAQSQYNAGQRNVLERFNAELNNSRDQFNAGNRLVIDQSNAQWRRSIATNDTVTTNRVNELNATNLLGISNTAYNNLWQYYADTMEWAWTSAENELNRYADMAIANLNADTQSEVAKRGETTAAGTAIGSLIGTLGSAYIMSSFCWVAREVYGKGNSEWFVFRLWIKHRAPKWFNRLYKKHGKGYAKFISNKPILKWATRKLMDLVVKEKERLPKCQII